MKLSSLFFGKLLPPSKRDTLYDDFIALRAERDCWAEKTNDLKGTDARRRDELQNAYRRIRALENDRDARVGAPTFDEDAAQARGRVAARAESAEEIRQLEDALCEALAMLMWYYDLQQWSRRAR